MGTELDSKEKSVLYVVCGPPGVGKSTVARVIADETDGRVFRTDEIRKELYPEPEYTTTETNVVYEELLSRAEECLRDGDTAVLDGTFSDRKRRVDALTVAETNGSRTEFVRVACEEETVKQRVENREGISDADFDIHLEIKETFDPLNEQYHLVDNSNSKRQTREQVLAVVRAGKKTPPRHSRG